MTTSTATGRRVLAGRRAAALTMTLVLSVLSYQLNASMLVPALPEIARTFDRDLAAVSQVSSLFFLSGAVSGLVLTRWSDFHGRRRALVIALVLLLVGTLLCLGAPTLELLLLGRLLQGASNATFNLTYLLLAAHVTPRLFGPAIGIVSAVNGGVAGLDALVGGVLVERANFRWIFVVILVVGGAATLAVWRVVPRDPTGEPDGRLDRRGAALVGLSVIGFAQTVSLASDLGWTEPVVLAVAAGSAVVLGIYVVTSRGRPTAFVPVSLLRARRVWPVLLTTSFALAGTFATMSFTLVLLGQAAVGLDLTASDAALLLLTPPALLGALTAPVVGRLAMRFGWLPMLRCGLIATLVPLATCATAPTNLPLVVASAAALGPIFNGCVLTTLNGVSVVQSSREALGLLPGLNGACYGLGTSTGIAVFAPTVAQGTIDDLALAIALGLAITALAAVTSFLIAPARDGN